MEGTFSPKGRFGNNEVSNKALNSEIIENIKVTDAVWVGDIATGNRTYKVGCDYNGDFMNAIRRYSQFEALRNILTTKFPQCIVPVLPPKTFSEKFTSDDSDQIKDRMRGLKKFLDEILNHNLLCESQDFINFLVNTDFPLEFVSSDFASVKDDRSTISKYFGFVVDTVVSTISGSEGAAAFKNKTELDFDFEKDYQKLKSLKEFMLKLHKNGESLKKLINDETHNCKSFKSLIANLQISIKNIETDQETRMTATDTFDQSEEEKKALSNLNLSASEPDTSTEACSTVAMIEEGIDGLSAAIDAIERRSAFRRRQEVCSEELQKLNNSSSEPSREKEMLEEKNNILKNKVDKINEVLKAEVYSCLENIEKNTIKYISGLMKVRKTHLTNQKDHWKKISSQVSLNSH